MLERLKERKLAKGCLLDTMERRAHSGSAAEIW